MCSRQRRSWSPCVAWATRVSCSSRSSTLSCGKCIRSTWPPFGQPRRLTLGRTCTTGIDLPRASDTSSRTCSPSSRRRTASLSRISPNASAPTCSCPRRAASTASRSRWRTSTQRRTACLSTRTSRTRRSETSSSTRSRRCRACRRRLTGARHPRYGFVARAPGSHLPRIPLPCSVC